MVERYRPPAPPAAAAVDDENNPQPAEQAAVLHEMGFHWDPLIIWLVGEDEGMGGGEPTLPGRMGYPAS